MELKLPPTVKVLLLTQSSCKTNKTFAKITHGTKQFLVVRKQQSSADLKEQKKKFASFVVFLKKRLKFLQKNEQTFTKVEVLESPLKHNIHLSENRNILQDQDQNLSGSVFSYLFIFFRIYFCYFILPRCLQSYSLCSHFICTLPYAMSCCLLPRQPFLFVIKTSSLNFMQFLIQKCKLFNVWALLQLHGQTVP